MKSIALEPRAPDHATGGASSTTTTTVIRADAIALGDVVLYDGHEHRITRIERCGGWAWPVAADDRGWAIALGDHLIEVACRLGANWCVSASPRPATS